MTPSDQSGGRGVRGMLNDLLHGRDDDARRDDPRPGEGTDREPGRYGAAHPDEPITEATALQDGDETRRPRPGPQEPGAHRLVETTDEDLFVARDGGTSAAPTFGPRAGVPQRPGPSWPQRPAHPNGGGQHDPRAATDLPGPRPAADAYGRPAAPDAATHRSETDRSDMHGTGQHDPDSHDARQADGPADHTTTVIERPAAESDSHTDHDGTERDASAATPPAGTPVVRAHDSATDTAGHDAPAHDASAHDASAHDAESRDAGAHDATGHGDPGRDALTATGDRPDSTPANGSTPGSTGADDSPAFGSSTEHGSADGTTTDGTTADRATTDGTGGSSANGGTAALGGAALGGAALGGAAALGSTAGSRTADSTAAGRTSADSTPVGSTSTDSTPVGSTSADSTPVGSTSADSMPVGSTSADSMSADGPVGSTAPGTTASTTAGGSAPGGTGRTAPGGPAAAAAPERLVPADRAQTLSSRWDAVKGSFVDEPRDAVRQADALVGELLDELDRLFREQRRDLEHGLDNDETTTEDLRLALRRYRSFFDRLIDL